MTASETSPVDCPHCGVRVGLTRGICPACRRDATDLRHAAMHREQARLAAEVKALIGHAKHHGVIRRVLRDRGEDAARVDAELRAQAAYYRSAAADRGGRELLRGGGLMLLGVVLSAYGALLYAWAAFAFGCMLTTWGSMQWRRSRRP